jgi:hypothetical protein
MTKTLVAAVAALLTVTSMPVSAQQENATRCSPGVNCRPIPPSPRPPPAPGPQQPNYVYPPPIYIYPQQQARVCVASDGREAELGRHDLTGRLICRVFADPGSYCECSNGFGEVFGGIVQ